MKLDKNLLPKRQAIQNAKNSVLTAVVIASVVVSFSVVAINFLWDLRGYNDRVADQKEIARDQLEENVLNVDSLTTEFALFEEGDVSSKEVLDALPSKYDYSALVTSIDQLAKRSGMLLESFSGDDLSESAPFKAIQPTPFDMPFSIEVTGYYKDLIKLVQNLDKSIRPIQITNVEISGTDDNIRATIDIMTYFQPTTDLSIESKEVQ